MVKIINLTVAVKCKSLRSHPDLNLRDSNSNYLSPLQQFLQSLQDSLSSASSSSYGATGTTDTGSTGSVSASLLINTQT